MEAAYSNILCMGIDIQEIARRYINPHANTEVYIVDYWEFRLGGCFRDQEESSDAMGVSEPMHST